MALSPLYVMEEAMLTVEVALAVQGGLELLAQVMHVALMV
jgi:hypothetical protein